MDGLSQQMEIVEPAFELYLHQSNRIIKRKRRARAHRISQLQIRWLKLGIRKNEWQQYGRVAVHKEQKKKKLFGFPLTLVWWGINKRVIYWWINRTLHKRVITQIHSRLDISNHHEHPHILQKALENKKHTQLADTLDFQSLRPKIELFGLQEKVKAQRYLHINWEILSYMKFKKLYLKK